MGAIIHNVSMVAQQSSPLCWVACCMMAIQYRRGQSIEANALGEQLELRMATRPGAPSNQVVYNNMRSIGFRLNRLSEIWVPGRHMPSMRRNLPGDVGFAAKIEHLLRTHGPIVFNHLVGSISYGPGVPIGNYGSHAVLITGIDTGSGSVYMHNPWGTIGVRDPQGEASGKLRLEHIANPITLVESAVQFWEGRGEIPFAYLP